MQNYRNVHAPRLKLMNVGDNHEGALALMRYCLEMAATNKELVQSAKQREIQTANEMAVLRSELQEHVKASAEAQAQAMQASTRAAQATEAQEAAAKAAKEGMEEMKQAMGMLKNMFLSLKAPDGEREGPKVLRGWKGRWWKRLERARRI